MSRTDIPLSTELVSFRAAGWLAAPDGESRASTIALIKDLVGEIERLRALLKPFAEAAKQGQVRLQILENGGVGAMGCRDGYLDQAMAHLCVKEFRDAQAALEPPRG